MPRTAHDAASVYGEVPLGYRHPDSIHELPDLSRDRTLYNVPLKPGYATLNTGLPQVLQ